MSRTKKNGWERHEAPDGRIARLGPVLATCSANELAVVDPTMQASIPVDVVLWLTAPMQQATDAAQRLRAIADLIEAVDNRCLAADGPVTKFQDEVTDAELRKLYQLATGAAPKTRQAKRKARKR